MAFRPGGIHGRGHSWGFMGGGIHSCQTGLTRMALSNSAGQWTGFAVQIPGGIKSVAAGAKGAYAMANSLDEAGKCANLLTKVIRGGCFVAGTLVTLSDMPRSQSADDAVWSSNPVWHGTPYRDSAAFLRNIAPSQTATITPLLASPSRMLVPIEQVPLGARVPTKNPKPWEYDANWGHSTLG